MRNLSAINENIESLKKNILISRAYLLNAKYISKKTLLKQTEFGLHFVAKFHELIDLSELAHHRNDIEVQKVYQMCHDAINIMGGAFRIIKMRCEKPNQKMDKDVNLVTLDRIELALNDLYLLINVQS